MKEDIIKPIFLRPVHQNLRADTTLGCPFLILLFFN